VTRAEAIDFIRPAAPTDLTWWTDLGAGSGTFTEALAHLLPAESTIVAVERDPNAVERLTSLAARLPRGTAAVTVARGDVEHIDRVAELSGTPWDGALFGNVLHFLPDPARVMAAAKERLSPAGRIVVIEYDRASRSRWVPYPLSVETLRALARDVRLGAPEIVNSKPSRYRGVLYCAVIEREGGGSPRRKTQVG
jgi:SAM-dependent methyltransferase